jgi:hypothetical protein
MNVVLSSGNVDALKQALDKIMTLLRPATFAAIATLCAAPMAQALDFGSGFSLKGQIDLDYLKASDDDFGLGTTDLTLGWRSQSGGALTFGADVSVTSFTEFDDGSTTASYYWGALVLGTTYGELSVGRPLPVLKRFFDTPEIGGTQLYDLLLNIGGDSALSYVVLISDPDVVGLTFKGTTGALTYGAGLHRVTSVGGEADVIELAASYQIDQATLFAAVETLDIDSAETIEKLQVGARYDADRWSAGVLVTDLSATGSDLQTIKLFGDYKITPNFKVGAQVLSVDEGSDSGEIYGLSTEYSFGPGGYAGLGLLDEEGASETAYTATVGFKF